VFFSQISNGAREIKSVGDNLPERGLLTKTIYLGTFQRVILELLRVAMVGIPNTKGFIVDGFPREMEQGKEFENEVSFALFC